MTPDVKSLVAPVPGWVLDGWYCNNPDRQQFAIARYRTPVCTAVERDAARAYNAIPKPATFACTVCGQFAFAEPTQCFWCRRGAR
jgi:hypothetical protein